MTSEPVCFHVHVVVGEDQQFAIRHAQGMVERVAFARLRLEEVTNGQAILKGGRNFAGVVFGIIIHHQHFPSHAGRNLQLKLLQSQTQFSAAVVGAYDN